MRTDALLDPFGTSWRELERAARAAEDGGFDGLWTWDHLAGGVHQQPSVHEAWTILSALAVCTTRVSLGPMVLNVANRDAGTLAVAAATLQDISGGRLLLGVGAGGGAGLPYTAEQHALGRDVAPDPERRAAVEDTVATLRSVWSGTVGPAAGFLRPVPAPPVIVGGFGPKMAALAGRVGDGLNAPAGARLMSLVGLALGACAEAGRNEDDFIVTASANLEARWVDRDSTERTRLETLGVDRLVLVADAGDAARIAAAGARLSR